MCIDSSSTVTVSSLVKSITLLDSMHMLKVAWQDLRSPQLSTAFPRQVLSLPTLRMMTAPNNPHLDFQLRSLVDL